MRKIRQYNTEEVRLKIPIRHDQMIKLFPNLPDTPIYTSEGCPPS